MPVIYKSFTVCNLMSLTEDAQYMARAALVSVDGSQRSLEIGTFDTKPEAMARAREGAIAWIDAEVGYAPVRLPTTRHPS